MGLVFCMPNHLKSPQPFSWTHREAILYPSDDKDDIYSTSRKDGRLSKQWKFMTLFTVSFADYWLVGEI